MGNIVDEGQEIVAAITAVRAYTDPAQAATNRPCLLLAPPVIDYAAGTATRALVEWQLLALTSQPAGNAHALAEFVDLIDAARTVHPIERCTPGAYQLAPGADPIPCYSLTFTRTRVGDTT